MALHPAVEWAQRKDKLYVTILVDDLKSPVVECTEERLKVKGVGGPEKKNYECDLEFFKSINNDGVKKQSSDRCLTFIIPKQESGAYWPRLLKPEKKFHWLKVDFDKWKDEDDEMEGGDWGEGDMDGPDMGDMGFGNMMQNMPPYENDFDDNDHGDEANDLDKSDDEEEEIPGLQDNSKESKCCEGEHAHEGEHSHAKT